jgi:hypothetical protein
MRCMVACVTQEDVAYYYATMGRVGGTRSEVVGDVWWLRCTAGQVATARREFHVHAWQGQASASRRLELAGAHAHADQKSGFARAPAPTTSRSRRFACGYSYLHARTDAPFPRPWLGVPRQLQTRSRNSDCAGRFIIPKQHFRSFTKSRQSQSA